MIFSRVLDNNFLQRTMSDLFIHCCPKYIQVYLCFSNFATILISASTKVTFCKISVLIDCEFLLTINKILFNKATSELLIVIKNQQYISRASDN